MTRHRWVYIDGEAVSANETSPSDPVAPLVMPDIDGYQSMVDGSWISSRSRHREHLRQHNVIEIGNEKFPVRKIKPVDGLKKTLIAIANEKLRYK